MDEGARDGDHCEGASSSSYHDHSFYGTYRNMPHVGRLCGTANSCVAFWQCHHVLATDGDNGSISGVRVFTLCVATLQHLVTSRPSLLDVSAQIQGASMPTSTHSHSLDGVAETVDRRW